MAYVILNLVCVAALVGIDQAIKLWATQYLAPVEAITVIPHVVELRFVLNQGMAFSLLSGKQLFLILATSAALLLVAYLLPQPRQAPAADRLHPRAGRRHRQPHRPCAER